MRDGACGRGELLVSVLYDEATTAERAEFDAHARECAACSAELAAFRDLRGELRSWETGPVPRVTIALRPSLAARLREAFALMPPWLRVAAAAGCAMLVLAALNLNVTVGGPNGTSVSMSLVPRPAAPAVEQKTVVIPQAPAGAAPSDSAPAVQVDFTPEQRAQIDRLVEEGVRDRLDARRAELDADLDKLQQRLATDRSAELRQMAARIEAQRRKIDALQRDLDRQAGYGSDLFSGLVNEPKAGG